MKAHSPTTPVSSRRQFLAATGAALAATALPVGSARAQQAAKYRRLNLTNPEAPLASYKKAVAAMLALPPADPRNWYRHAFIHTLDCPHGNWWLLPWHRAYIGWFERICRDLSGDPHFALPYWDWTVLPRIPEPFFDGVLNPENNAFIASLDEFKKQFQDPMSALWKSFTPAQIQQLAARKYQSMDDVWAVVTSDPMFVPISQARSLTAAEPGFDKQTLDAVSPAKLKAALQPKDFISFGSGIAPQHSSPGTAQGILEGFPHNQVHNNINGFMGDFLSPVDPIFFMHHANIDRIWDVWTRRQLAAKLPTVPAEPDLDHWKKEPFLFYIDSQGKNTAGDYATIGDFDYDYQPGSGESTSTKLSPFSNKHWLATVLPKSPASRNLAEAEVMLPEALPAAASANDNPALFARVTLKPGTDTKGIEFQVLVNPAPGNAPVSSDDPSFAGSFSVFGRRAEHSDKALTFTVPIAEAVAKLRAANRLDPSQKIQVHVVASRPGAANSPVDLNVAEISVGAF